MTDTVADDVEDYIIKAIALGTNNELRQKISDKIRKNINLLYEDLTSVKALETFYLDTVNNN